jgi:hypothetical protein
MRMSRAPRDAGTLAAPAVVASTVLAVITVTFAHEALGHGIVCLAVGGHPTVVSTSMFWCTAPRPVVAAGGPAMNLLVGLLALVLLRRSRRRSAAASLYLILVTAFAWFWEGGYAVQAMLLGRGDLWDLIAHTAGPPSAVVRVAVAGAGAALYATTTVATRRALGALQPGGRRAARVSRLAWLGAAAAAFLAAVTSPLGAVNLLDTTLAIGAAGLPLLVLPPRASAARAGRPARTSRVLVAGAAVAYVVFVLTMGLGLRWAP